MILKKYMLLVAFFMSISLYTSEKEDRETAKNFGLAAGTVTFLYCVSKGKIIAAPVCSLLTAYGVRAGAEVVLRDGQDIGAIKNVTTTAIDVAADVLKEVADFGSKIIKKITAAVRDSQ